MIELRNITCGYGGKAAISDISLPIAPGRVTALIGPNGSGKSTLLRAVARLLRLESGTILVDGADASDYTRREYARKVALLPQSRDIPALTARTLAAHGRYPHMPFPRRMTKGDWEKVDRALLQMSAADLANRDMASLSGGERQRVYIAMALIQDAQTLLLDEPAAFLDAGSQFELISAARRLALEGRAVFMALHDLSQALTYADTVAVMDGGRLRYFGPAEDIGAQLLEEVFNVRACWATTDGAERYRLILPRRED